MRIRQPCLISHPSRGHAWATEALITAAVLATLAASVPAQRLFEKLREPGLPFDLDWTMAVALGDVDGDGDLDMVFGNTGDGYRAVGDFRTQLYLNDGSGTFTEPDGHLPRDADETRAVALGDVDGDGDLDLVIGNDDYYIHSRNRLYLNDGSGTFTDATAARMPADNDDTSSVALGDVDGDGDLDMVIGNRLDPSRLYLNDGSGAFTDATAARLPAGSTGHVLGDVDGDGDLDMIGSGLYLNDGGGTFTDVTAARMPVDSHGRALADVDGDGDLDMIGNGLYLNDGGGTFTDVTAERMPADSNVRGALAMGDVDGDGDLDLVFGNRGQNQLYLNDGIGTYTDVTLQLMPPDGEHTRSVALGDIDGDGDLDMVFGNFIAQNRRYLNLLRQLDAPFPVTPGSEFRLDAYARSGPPRLADVAFSFVSTAKATTPLPPFGTIGIDLLRSTALPPLFIPQPSGMSSVSFTVPADPNLIGVQAYAQALFSSGGLWPLTNVTASQIVPLALHVTGLPTSMENKSSVDVSVAVTGAAASGVTVTVTTRTTGNFVDGLVRLRRPDVSSQTIPTIEPGATETVTWRIRAIKHGPVTIWFTLTDGTGATVQTVARNLFVH